MRESACDAAPEFRKGHHPAAEHVIVELSDVELAAESQDVREVCAGAYDRWQRVLSDGLERAGLPAAEAQAKAELVLAAIEGALLLARVRRDGDIVRRVAAALTA